VLPSASRLTLTNNAFINDYMPSDIPGCFLLPPYQAVSKTAHRKVMGVRVPPWA